MPDVSIEYVKSIFKSLRDVIDDKEVELLEIMEESNDYLNEQIEEVKSNGYA